MWTYAGTYNDGTKRTSQLFVGQLKLKTSDVCWYLAAVELWVTSVLPGLFLQPEDFAHDVFALHGEVEAFAQNCSLRWCCSFLSQASLVRLCSRCFWRRRCRLHSSDSAVFSFITFIAVRSCLKQIARRKLHSQKGLNLWFCGENSNSNIPKHD